MIRAELFFEPQGCSLGLELQCFRLNFQFNIGLRLLCEFEAGKKMETLAVFAGLGPFAVVAWIDPKPRR